MFLLFGSYSLQAADGLGGDQAFMKDLDSIKSPFEEGFPKPIVVVKNIVAPVYKPQKQYKPFVKPKPRPKPVPVKPVEIVLPALKLQGVMVGEDIYQAIINDQIVPLLGVIEGAQVKSISKQGVELLFKGKKFLLKVE